VLRLGVDVGGTFTDLVLVDDAGHTLTRKVPTTPGDHSAAILDALDAIVADLDTWPSALGAVVHGTTIATNTIIEQRGAPTGLLTTRGFRDTLEIGRLRYPRLYDLTWSKPAPLVERRWRLEIDERLDRDGAIVAPLDAASARRAIAYLRDEGVQAIAVCLLHAFANPAHERELAELIADEAPGLAACLSSDVLPEVGEFERTSTTVINAYLQPVVGRYLDHLQNGLAERGVDVPVLVMQSNGGVMSARAAVQRPMHIVESGAAAGVVAAQRLTAALEAPNVITLDMGGTTAKAAILEDGRPAQVAEYEVGGGISVGNRLYRGGGYPLRAPALDIAEVGAGGGSLVWVDAGGALHVGPRSAGSAPGPVCYRRGGTEPTLTDANLLLGYLNPRALLGGTLAIDADYARAVFEERVGRPIGRPLHEAAYGVHRIAAANMVRVVKAVSSERGRDPRCFSLVAFGGNGPVHAALVAAELAMRRVIVPPAPGVFSAVGLLDADLAHHLSRSVLKPTRRLAAADVEQTFQALEAQGRRALAEEGYSADRTELKRSVDVRYVGQSFELRLPIDGAVFADGALDDVERRFAVEHERTYGHRADDDPVELVNVRVMARGLDPRPPVVVRGTARSPTLPRSRAAYFGAGVGWAETPVYLSRAELDRTPRTGPLIVEEYDATTIVPPGCHIWRDASDNLILELDQPW
jgi:N-methylhydantoinase A